MIVSESVSAQKISVAKRSINDDVKVLEEFFIDRDAPICDIQVFNERIYILDVCGKSIIANIEKQ